MSKNPLVPRARALRKTMTKPEVLLWLDLRKLNATGFRFRRQVPLLGYIADFACFASRLVIEVDGRQHGFDAYRLADEARDAALLSQGFQVFRFANEDVLTSRESVVETILAHAPSTLHTEPPASFSGLRPNSEDITP